MSSVATAAEERRSNGTSRFSQPRQRTWPLRGLGRGVATRGGGGGISPGLLLLLPGAATRGGSGGGMVRAFCVVRSTLLEWSNPLSSSALAAASTATCVSMVCALLAHPPDEERLAWPAVPASTAVVGGVGDKAPNGMEAAAAAAAANGAVASRAASPPPAELLALLALLVAAQAAALPASATSVGAPLSCASASSAEGRSCGFGRSSLSSSESSGAGIAAESSGHATRNPCETRVAYRLHTAASAAANGGSAVTRLARSMPRAQRSARASSRAEAVSRPCSSGASSPEHGRRNGSCAPPSAPPGRAAKPSSFTWLLLSMRMCSGRRRPFATPAAWQNATASSACEKQLLAASGARPPFSAIESNSSPPWQSSRSSKVLPSMVRLSYTRTRCGCTNASLGLDEPSPFCRGGSAAKGLGSGTIFAAQYMSPRRAKRTSPLEPAPRKDSSDSISSRGTGGGVGCALCVSGVAGSDKHCGASPAGELSTTWLSGSGATTTLILAHVNAIRAAPTTEPERVQFQKEAGPKVFQASHDLQ